VTRRSIAGAPLPLLLALSACGDSTGPVPVASVQVTGAGTAPLTIGQTVQLTAVARDANGNDLTGRTVTWSSSAPAVASVSPTGLVTAVATGGATISATIEGRTGSAAVTVAGLVVLTSVQPAALRAGEPATLRGQGFSPNPASNVVTVGGEAAIVTQASATELQILVAADACQVTGPVSVRVTVSGEASNPLNHPFQADGAPLQMAVGTQQVLTGQLCLRFGPSAANETYLIGLQSTSQSAASLTPARVSGSIAGVAAAAGAAAAPRGAAFQAAAAAAFAPDASPRAQRWARHRQAERGLRAEDARLLSDPVALAAARSARGAARAGAPAAQAAAVPATVAVGDTVTIRVPEIGNSCAGFFEIRTVVRVVGERGIWLEDVANPSGGFTTADFQQLSATFDTRIHATNLEYFGPLTDRDQNGRVVIVTTRQVNRQGTFLGFVASADLFPRSTCAASDFGEIYYGRAPDPNGAAGEAYSLEDAKADAPLLIAHEVTHLIQFGARVDAPAPLPPLVTWNLEGQAVLAEEVNGFAALGLQPGQNHGFNVAFSGLGLQGTVETPTPWFAAGFFDLILYYGFRDASTSVTGAPEQCTWLALPDAGNTGPCDGRSRAVYGVPWLLLRWLSDHFGPDAGGEAAFHRQLVQRGSIGFQAIEAITGTPARTLLAQWAAALYVDDRVAAATPRLTFRTWNLVNIEARLVDTARLRPRDRPFGAFTDQVSVRGGSTAYFLVGGTSRPATVVRARDLQGGALPATMQLWVVRLN
jgi:hypothetical protein